MSPTVSELGDVLDWQAIAVLHTLDERDGATTDRLVAQTDLDMAIVETRCQQLETLGLVASGDADGATAAKSGGNAADSEDFYEVTGSGHGAIGAGLYDEFDLVGDADLDELAEEVAELLERRDDLEGAVTALREDAASLRARATRQFGDRDDVAAEFDSLLTDLEDLAERLEAD
jgi:hypothetical protein